MNKSVIMTVIFYTLVNSEILLDVNFNNHDPGKYTQAMLDRDWFNPGWEQGVSEGRVTVVMSPSFNEKALRVHYPSLGIGPENSGAQWKSAFSGKDEMYAAYHIFFPNNWDPVKGGKLPGLCGGECPSGGDSVTGYNGFSTRYMFRPGMKLVVYCYHMDKPGEYGEDFELAYTFSRNTWYNLVQRVKMNTPGQKNGELHVWVDGMDVLHIDTLRFRLIDTININQFYFSTFYGGSTPDWAPLEDQYIYYDDFRVYTDANTLDYAEQTNAHLQTYVNKLSSGAVVINQKSDPSLKVVFWNVSGTKIAEFSGEHTVTNTRIVLQRGIYIISISDGDQKLREKIILY